MLLPNFASAKWFEDFCFEAVGCRWYLHCPFNYFSAPGINRLLSIVYRLPSLCPILKNSTTLCFAG